MAPKKPPEQISKQRRYQIRKHAEGKCGICGKPRRMYAYCCDECQIKYQKRNGMEVGIWYLGKRGRVPNSIKESIDA